MSSDFDDTDLSASEHLESVHGDSVPLGNICELRTYESILNGKGERVVLSAGTRRMHRNKDARSKESALTLTKFWNRSRDGFRTELEVQSPHMKKALKECIPTYEDVDIDHKTIIIAGEPRCLFHYQKQLIEYRKNCSRSGDNTAQQHVQYLLDYMATQFISQLHIYNQMVEDVDLAEASMSFLDLWMVFAPGGLLYLPGQINKVQGMVYGKLVKFQKMSRCECTNAQCTDSKWSITAHSIDTNGEDFGHVAEVFSIQPYEGFTKLADLDIVPLRLHPDQEAIKEELLSRGRRFLAFSTTSHHQHYDGIAKLKGDFGSLKTIRGRVMLDAGAFYEANPPLIPSFVRTIRIFRTKLGEHNHMTDEELLICNGTAFGYSLTEMQWGVFNINMITDFQYNIDAFASFIFDQDYKDMILSLVRIHQDERASFDDIVQGKGRGMIFLLHGEPGVGKTLTAESVADYTRKPLLRIQAEALGSDAHSVEKALTSAFRLAARWNGIALLDEADVFLEERGSRDLGHNCLVAVFLRMVEYYEGILFLTTNRVSSFDRAFKSRIHLAVHYPPLDFVARQKIWRVFLSRLPNNAGKDLLDSGRLSEIRDDGLNGRQIKNIVRTAHSLAVSNPHRSGSAASLQFEDIEKALKAMHKFNTDFEGEVISLPENRGDLDRDDSGVNPKKKKRKLGE